MSMPYGAALQQRQQNNLVPAVPSTYAAIAGVSNSGREAIRDSQRAHPEWYFPTSYKVAFDQFVDNVENKLNPNAPPSVPVAPSAPRAAAARVKPSTIDYFNADLAKRYGMSKSTAYQEALANTSYQRAVKDMQSAGLNPAVLFGGGRATPANSAVYAAEDQPAGSGGFSYGGRSYGSKNKKLFSSSVYSALSMIGGLVGIAATKRPDGYWIGSQISKGGMGLLDALFN